MPVIGYDANFGPPDETQSQESPLQMTPGSQTRDAHLLSWPGAGKTCEFCMGLIKVPVCRQRPNMLHITPFS